MVLDLPWSSWIGFFLATGNIDDIHSYAPLLAIIISAAVLLFASLISSAPNIKVTKLQDNKSVLIELENSGWRFFSKDGLIGVETGLYFGNKNKYIENQNIFISGITQNNEQLIEWQISKIWVIKLS